MNPRTLQSSIVTSRAAGHALCRIAATWTERSPVFVGLALLAVLLSCTQALYAGGPEFGPPFIITGGFTVPSGLGIDGLNGRVLVVDTGNHRVKYSPLADLATSPTPTWAEFGYVEDRSIPEALNEPQAVAVDPSGNAYVVDTFGNEIQLYRWSAESGAYSHDPRFARATRHVVAGVNIQLPRDVAVGPDGRVYLLDSGNHRILVADGPDDDSWEVWRENRDWGNPYGLDVADDGTVYIADTDHSRILRVHASGPEESIGRYGTGNGQFRHPRDVAVARDGRLFVADTYNHRVVVLNADGSHHRNLGAAPLFGNLQKIHVDADNRVFVVDSDYNRLVAYLGPVDHPPFDAYIRDVVGDTGAASTAEDVVLFSPDILVRHHPDVDLASAATTGLEAYPFEQPRYEQNNYVYLAVRNRGTHGIAGVIAKVYWADPEGVLDFPADWRTEGLFRSYISESVNEAGNSLELPFIEPRRMEGLGGVDGVSVVGPLVWRPPAPERAGSRWGSFYLLVRLLHLNDPSEAAPGLDQVRLNNNIALRPAVTVRWEHADWRCPPEVRRTLRVPEEGCPGVFENGAAPRGAEEVWTLTVPDLRFLAGPITGDTLFRFRIPNPGDPGEGGHADIRPRAAPFRGDDPEPLPECGLVRRDEFGPRGRDNTVHVGVSGALTVEVIPDRREPAEDASIRLYRDGVREDDLGSGPAFRKVIDCPRSARGLTEVVFSIHGRDDERPDVGLAGSYGLTLEYKIAVERGIPDWVGEEMDAGGMRGIGGLPCLGGPSDALPGRGFMPGAGLGFIPRDDFPFCPSLPLGPAHLELEHPRDPSRPGCRADGPGCPDFFTVHWPSTRAPFDVTFVSRANLSFELFDASKNLIGQAIPVQRISRVGALGQVWHGHLHKVALSPSAQSPLIAKRLLVPQLAPGLYVLVVRGPRALYSVDFFPPPVGEEQGPRRTLSVADARGEAGTTVTIPVVLSEGKDIAGVQFTLTFDPAVLSLATTNPARLGSLVPGDFSLAVNSAMPGRATVVILPPKISPISTFKPGAGPVAHVSLDVSAAAQRNLASPLKLSGVSVSTAKAEAVTVSPKDGVLIVSSSLRGDVNHDGMVNVQDVVRLIQHITGELSLATSDLVQADVNGDGQVSDQDVANLVRHLTGGKALLPR